MSDNSNIGPVLQRRDLPLRPLLLLHPLRLRLQRADLAGVAGEHGRGDGAVLDGVPERGKNKGEKGQGKGSKIIVW